MKIRCEMSAGLSSTYSAVAQLASGIGTASNSNQDLAMTIRIRHGCRMLRRAPLASPHHGAVSRTRACRQPHAEQHDRAAGDRARADALVEQQDRADRGK